MTKFTVTLVQTHMSYTKAEIEVEADSETDAANLAKAMSDLKWEPTGDEDSGSLDIEVESEDGPTTSWRED